MWAWRNRKRQIKAKARIWPEFGLHHKHLLQKQQALHWQHYKCLLPDAGLLSQYVQAGQSHTNFCTPKGASITGRARDCSSSNYSNHSPTNLLQPIESRETPLSNLHILEFHSVLTLYVSKLSQLIPSCASMVHDQLQELSIESNKIWGNCKIGRIDIASWGLRNKPAENSRVRGGETRELVRESPRLAFVEKRRVRWGAGGGEVARSSAEEGECPENGGAGGARVQRRDKGGGRRGGEQRRRWPHTACLPSCKTPAKPYLHSMTHTHTHRMRESVMVKRIVCRSDEEWRMKRDEEKRIKTPCKTLLAFPWHTHTHTQTQSEREGERMREIEMYVYVWWWRRLLFVGVIEREGRETKRSEVKSYFPSMNKRQDAHTQTERECELCVWWWRGDSMWKRNGRVILHHFSFGY